MATPKEEPLVEISSTFDMTIIIWIFLKKHFIGTFWKKKTSNMVRTFLQVSIGCWIRNVIGDFYLNLDIQNRHFNILIRKWKLWNHAIICKFIIARGANEGVVVYGGTPVFIPFIFSPSSPHFHSSSLFHNFSFHTFSFISREFQFCQFEVSFSLISSKDFFILNLSFSNYNSFFFFFFFLLWREKIGKGPRKARRLT